MRKDFDAVAKIAIVGDSTVGKTNLMLRYTNAVYVQTHVATIGIDFKVKILNLEDYRIKMQIWDTAGQERFRNLTSSIYQGAQAVIVVIIKIVRPTPSTPARPSIV
jgi:Ras-related protein Rab-1A